MDVAYECCAIRFLLPPSHRFTTPIFGFVRSHTPVDCGLHIAYIYNRLYITRPIYMLPQSNTAPSGLPSHGPTEDSEPAPSQPYIGHNYIDHNYLGHNYLGHNYLGHNYLGHNFICQVRAQRGVPRRQVQRRAAVVLVVEPKLLPDSGYGP